MARAACQSHEGSTRLGQRDSGPVRDSSGDDRPDPRTVRSILRRFGSWRMRRVLADAATELLCPGDDRISEPVLLAGGQIVEIDGQTAEGMSPDKAVEVLTGRPGTEVKLSVLHEGAEDHETITITRAIIDVPSVLGDQRKPDDQWDFLIDKAKKIGY